MVNFVYAAIGMEFYGGHVSFKEPKMKSTDYVEDNFESLNFNDMASSMLLCLQLLVVNDFDVLVDGFVSLSGRWTRLFFSLFYLTGVLLFLSL